MAKDKPEVDADTPAQAGPPQTFEMTLTEFCQGLSSSDTRVEMIAGFYADETARGHVKDHAEAFTARYEAFQVRPV